jgi:chemotaxis protein MotA
MDPATLIGILLAFGSVFAMVTMEGGHVESLLLLPPMVLVFGATLAVGLAGSTLKSTLHAFKSIPAAVKGRTVAPLDSIDQVVTLAEKARSEGLLSLEADAQETKDSFLAGALQNIADGTDGDELRLMLEDEIHSKKVSDQTASKFFRSLGGYAPTIGIIGTVVSLTHVLENLSDPSNLGPMIASAFVATLWGLLTANFLWLPLADRLAKISELELDRMTLLMEGVLAVQAGSQPLLLRERLKSMVPPHTLKAGKDGSSAGKKDTKGTTKDGRKDKLKAAA